MTDPRTDNDDRRMEEAISWFLRLSDPEAPEALVAEHAEWMAADPENAFAYARIEYVGAAVDESRADLAERFADELLSGTAQPARSAPTQRKTPFGSGWSTGYARRLLPLAAAILVAALVALVLEITNDATTRYVTQPAERQQLQLADGSEIDMSAATTLDVTRQDGQSLVRLISGQAFFSVTPQKGRPFQVDAGGRRIRVVGTAFDVLKTQKETTVTVVEGIVDVAPSPTGPQDSNAQAKRIEPGWRLTYRAADGSTNLQKVDTDAATAWRKGYLIYEGSPLADVVADVNRYFAANIQIADIETGALSFTGVLQLEDPQVIIARLEAFLPIEVQRQDDATILRQVMPDGGTGDKRN